MRLESHRKAYHRVGRPALTLGRQDVARFGVEDLMPLG